MRVLIGEPGKVEAAALKVSERMVATLSGGSAFDVSPSGPQATVGSHKETTDWIWHATPKAVGEQVLILKLDALISINGKMIDERSIHSGAELQRLCRMARDSG